MPAGDSSVPRSLSHASVPNCAVHGVAEERLDQAERDELGAPVVGALADDRGPVRRRRRRRAAPASPGRPMPDSIGWVASGTAGPGDGVNAAAAGVGGAVVVPPWSTPPEVGDARGGRATSTGGGRRGRRGRAGRSRSAVLAVVEAATEAATVVIDAVANVDRGGSAVGSDRPSWSTRRARVRRRRRGATDGWRTPECCSTHRSAPARSARRSARGGFDPARACDHARDGCRVRHRLGRVHRPWTVEPAA